MADKYSGLKPASAGELAAQFVKEAASGAFSSSRGGAAAKAARVIAKRSRTGQGEDSFDSNTYHSRQHTDDANQ